MQQSPLLSPEAVDMVIPTRRGVEFIAKLLQETTKDPFWMRHTFIVVVDAETEDSYNAIKQWYKEAKEEIPLPWLTLEHARPEARGNVSRLRQQGLELGTHPYVYFQDDDDPLPKGLERRLTMMKNTSWDAIYGATETATERGQMIERFPPLTAGGQYAFDPIVGSKIFPTYLHPSSALFRRTLFEKQPFDDGQHYHIAGNAAFFTRLLHGNAQLTALPDVVRYAIQHDDNVSEPIMPGWQRVDLAADIRHWVRYISDTEIADFQREVADMLEVGEISTFKEIDALVEDALDSGRFDTA